MIAGCRRWDITPPLGMAQLNWQHPLTRNLVGCWLLNEGGGTNALNLANREANGTLGSAAKWAYGRHGQSALLDGTATSQIDCNHTSLDISSSYTMSLWFYATTLAERGLIYWGTDAGTGTRRAMIIWNGAGSHRIYSSTNSSNIAGATTLVPGQWYHSAVTVSGAGATRIYLNGRIDGTGTNTLNAYTYGGTDFGVINAANRHVGRMQTVLIYSRVLTDSEIWTLYAKPLEMLLPRRSNFPLWVPVAAGGTNPKGPLNNPFAGPFGGPI